jgi:hypothetical protein
MVYFTETNNIFCEEILPLVKNAKLELPLDSADPLIPYQFHYADSGWGQQWDSNFNYDEEQLSDSWDYDTVSGYLYEGTAKWGNELSKTANAWSEPAQPTSMWQDSHLPNEGSELINQGSSVRNTDTEDSVPGSNIHEEGVGLMIEEDDVEESDQGNSSSSSTEEI